MGDHCSGGACVAGTPKTCDEATSCTDDTCNTTTGDCVFTPNDANTCSDGNACTIGDHCWGGTCVAGTREDVRRGQPRARTIRATPRPGICVHAEQQRPCSDGNACTKAITARGGSCRPGRRRRATTTNRARMIRATPRPGMLSHAQRRRHVQRRKCLHEWRSAARGVVPWPGRRRLQRQPIVHGRYVQHHDRGLRVHAQRRQHVQRRKCLHDGDHCSGGTCLAGTPKTCNDKQSCTDDTCDTTTGDCVFTPNDANTCSDGNACTQTDTCQGGVCTGSNPVTCTADQVHAAGTCDQRRDARLLRRRTTILRATTGMGAGADVARVGSWGLPGNPIATCEWKLSRHK